ncbi:MAG: hypothetical protein A3H27_06755 [Acidobacteria bacterium RIFCSPLOWO2_02_FULL_59_13]|nr:MAG: hypothetical protein A3H27_06755 [Acidobacteria bacterium RIFCSPLOWO2_02_FULL_59_13]
MSYKRGILGGLIAGMVMGMWEMAAEQVAGGNGFWAPLTYIAATVLRDYQQVPTPVSFAMLPAALGLMGHMMNSVLLGAVFIKLALRISYSATSRVALGLAYGVLVLGIMWLAVLPLVDPVMLRLNFAAFSIGHIMWGLALGVAVAWEPAVKARWSHDPA